VAEGRARLRRLALVGAATVVFLSVFGAGAYYLLSGDDSEPPPAAAAEADGDV
jgi:hypothetical protein